MLIASHHNNDPYTPVCAWPEDCYVQWGDNGLVFTGHELGTGIETLAGALSGKKECAESAMQMLKQSYVTAFFEAFPKDPQTFIRGEGKTVEEAEQQAFEQFQKYRACPNHEFERRDYKNGAGLCKHCDLFNSKAFKPIA